MDLNTKANNIEHHTHMISKDQLIVRRGQPFNVTLKLAQAFNPDSYPLSVVAVTGQFPSEGHGTKSCFGVPDGVKRAPSAKAIWKIELHKNSSPRTGVLILTITPPADTPIGQYTLSVIHRDQEMLLATPVVLFNPWCPDDWVFLPDEQERQEYVMNEQGIIYRGSTNYINSMKWDFGQFEDNMVNICLTMLDINHKHSQNPLEDESARCNPIYVSRVVSAMINCEDDSGVMEGNWDGSFAGGVPPSQWNGSYAILKQWFNSKCSPVKYGQCWVFAGVMCSVMRLLGIPCRVITNFESAHDSNKNLIIDRYHSDYGVAPEETVDSIWNFHVWVEGWMKRPDLAADGKYDGWQAVDPTPQEKSGGVYCCGPASVKAILNGETGLRYDTPFVYAEVNADCVDWLVKADNSKVNICSDTNIVGQNISTKAVGSNKRVDITDTYKYVEGSGKERDVYKYACSKNPGDTENTENGGTEDHPPPVTMRFDEVTKPTNGTDLSLVLVLHSKSAAAKQLSINISVQAMRYNGSPTVNIQSDVKEETLQPGQDLSISVLVPFSIYRKSMAESDSMRVAAMVTDKDEPDSPYMTTLNVVLAKPPLTMTISGEVRVNKEATVELVFKNPINETLKNCSLTVSGSGLMEEEKNKLPDLSPNKQVRVRLTFVPYKTGQKVLIASFSCSVFKYVKSSCTVNVKK
ncbi:protein-glutamine gamma-glutamyltransferase E-like isoform X2 [Channa argus]